MKHLRFLILASVLGVGMMWSAGVSAQTYQTKLDTMWGNWCYKFQNGEFYSKQESKTVMSTTSTPSTGLTLVYYLRIPSTGARADLVYTPKYARMPKVKLTVTRVSTGDTLCVKEIQNTSLAMTGKENRAEILPYTTFPADEYYRFELDCDNWSYITNIKQFLFQRTSTMPILQHPQGGYGQHLFNWSTTIPEAPLGQAYDWAYQEVLVPREYQHPADYYCTIATLSCYCGIQSVGRVGDNFNRTVLFSCWDTGNTDENPNLPQYLRAKVYDYNHKGVSGHGGGEGSSGTIQLNNKTDWWRSDEWVQFLINARPENADEYETNLNSGEKEVHSVENTLLTVWYKMASDSAWTYLATIREACKNEMIGSWYSFIENFGGGEGHQPHKVYYRHGYMRSAASGKWYNRNQVGFSHYGDRTTRTDRYSGTTSLYENAFQMTYGGWGLPTDSSNVAGLPATDIAVDTINLDPLNKRIDQAAQLWRHYTLNEGLNMLSPEIPHSNWTVVSCTGSNGAGALNENKGTSWESNSSTGHDLVLKSKSGVVAVNSIRVHHTEGRTVRVRYVDAYTSEDGENWTLQAENVMINNEDDNEITFPTTLRSEYFKYHFHEQLDPNTSPRVKYSTLAFRGEFDADKLKALAKKIIDNENTLEYYKSEDIAQLKAIYNNGDCSNMDELSDEIKHIYKDCFPLMYGRAASTSYITATKAYLLQNYVGQGNLCADAQGVAVKGATAATSLDYAKTPVSAVDSLNVWQILRSEKFSGVYVYNIGTHKYLNPSVEGWLSEEPYPFVTGISGKACSFRSAKEGAPEFNKYLCINTSIDTPFSWGNLNDNARFLLLEDYYMRPDNAESLELLNKTFADERLEACKQRLQSLLQVPDNRVGSIASQEEKAALEEMYNGGDVFPENVERFIELVENINLLKLDTDHVYKFTPKAAETTNMAINSNGLVTLAASLNKPGSYWSVAEEGNGAKIISQGKGLSMLPRSTSGSPKTGKVAVVNGEKATRYYLTESKAGEFKLSDYSYPTYGLGYSSSEISSVYASGNEALWNVDAVNTISIRTNSVGVAALYVDFDLVVGEGQEVYVANHLTADGVIKLSAMTGVVPAHTPVLIKGEPSTMVTLGVAAPKSAPYEYRNIFKGNLLKSTNLQKNQYYILSTNNGEPKMKKAMLSNQVNDNEIYIAKEGNMPDLQYYSFDFDNIIDSVDDAAVPQATAPTTCYDLQGRPVKADAKGIHIEGNKVVKK